MYFAWSKFGGGMSEVIKIKSILTCVKCEHKKEETMPQYASQIEYKCNNCNSIIGVKQNQCCVYCIYGSTPCPSSQRTSQLKESYSIPCSDS